MLEFLGKKMGMTHMYNEDGSCVPLTMIYMYDNIVYDYDNSSQEQASIVLAFDKCDNAKKLKKPVAGKFIKKNLPLYKKLHKSKVKNNQDFKIGDSIKFNSLIKKGDKISISGISIGKGFAGGMKRWGFGGLEATHGVSISHRSHGSIGQCQDPGKVMKGKKMAGHMGVKKVSVKNLEVLYISEEESYIAVKGAVPGSAGKDVVLRFKNNY